MNPDVWEIYDGGDIYEDKTNPNYDPDLDEWNRSSLWKHPIELTFPKYAVQEIDKFPFLTTYLKNWYWEEGNHMIPFALSGDVDDSELERYQRTFPIFDLSTPDTDWMIIGALSDGRKEWGLWKYVDSPNNYVQYSDSLLSLIQGNICMSDATSTLDLDCNKKFHHCKLLANIYKEMITTTQKR
jgi:hypothetical protein